jgi:hypothetical protein
VALIRTDVSEDRIASIHGPESNSSNTVCPMNVTAVTDKRKKSARRIEDTDCHSSLAETDKKRRKWCHDGPESNNCNTVCPPNVPAVTHKRKNSAERIDDTDSHFSFAQPGKKRRYWRHDCPESNSSNIV